MSSILAIAAAVIVSGGILMACGSFVRAVVGFFTAATAPDSSEST